MALSSSRQRKAMLVVCVFLCVAILLKLAMYSGNDTRHFDGWDALNKQNEVVRTLARKDDIQRNTLAVPRGHMFAVMSCGTPLNNDHNCAFYLPLTALAWERYGYRSVVLIAGHRDVWEKDPTLNITLKFLELRDAVVIFVETPDTGVATMSKVLPLFAANIHNFADSDYLISVGWNQWPLIQEIFLLPKEKDVLLVNYNCCGSIQWRKEKHVALSLVNIGTSAQKWREIIQTGNEVAPDSLEDMLQYLKKEFGGSAYGGSIIEWNMGEVLASVKFGQWLQRNGSEQVVLVPRDVKNDRIGGDENNWKVPNPISKNDSILVNHGYREQAWSKIRPLLWQMYGKGSPPHRWCEEYVIKFRNTFPDRTEPHGQIKLVVEIKDLFNHIVGGLL